MPRKRADTAPPVARPLTIRPTDFGWLTDWKAALGLSDYTLAREVKLGRLRVGQRGGKLYALGSWVLAWLRCGELARKESSPVDELVFEAADLT